MWLGNWSSEYVTLLAGLWFVSAVMLHRTKHVHTYIHTYIHTDYTEQHITSDTTQHNTTAYTERKISSNYHTHSLTHTHTYSLFPELTTVMYATNTLLVTAAYDIATKSSEERQTSYRPHAHSQSYKVHVITVIRGGSQISRNRHMKH